MGKKILREKISLGKNHFWQNLKKNPMGKVSHRKIYILKYMYNFTLMVKISHRKIYILKYMYNFTLMVKLYVH